MKKKSSLLFLISAVCFVLFLVFTVLVAVCDKGSVTYDETGKITSVIGFSKLNQSVFNAIGTNDLWHEFTEFLGVIAIGTAAIFALIGIGQLAKRKSIWAVDREILLLAALYILIVLFCVPLPMILAIMMNELRCVPLKKSVQTIIYIPHFFTWVVVYSVFFVMFGSTGMVNTLIKYLGGQEVLFFMRGNWFRFLLVISNAWKGAGWGTIVYLSAITAIDSEIYEAAVIDGASKMQQVRHITVPSLLPTLVLMLTIRLGSILSGGFDQVLAFYNPTVYQSADILGTFIYRQGIGRADFSYASAVGLFESAVGLMFVMISNFCSKRLTGRTVW